MGAPFWLEDELEPFARRRLDGTAEFAVIGGGVTGCSCALTLASAGRRVRLYEARELAGGASGRNGGFALRGGAMAYDVARAQLGRETARAYWRLSERYVERLAELAGDAFRRVGSLRLAADGGERDELRAEYEALVEDGFAAEWRDELDGRLGKLFPAALFHPGDGSLAPARWIRRLAARASEAGAELREHERVESLEDLDEERVVIATDGYTSGLVPALDAAIQPVRNQVLVTAPLAERLYELPHYARHGYDYWQQLPDARLVVGGRRDDNLAAEATAEEALTPEIQAGLDELTRSLVGDLPEVTHRWAGIFGETADRMPLAGPLPGQARVWVAAGYSGHGNVLGLACGDLVGRALLGEEVPELAWFHPARRGVTLPS
jgi:gamma-glutamylputrescine oxidase